MDLRRVACPSGVRSVEAIGTMERILALAPLRRTRALLRNRRARLVAAGIAVAYLFLSMILGQMLTFTGLPGPLFVSVQWTGSPWYDYPDLFVFNAGVAVDLLLLPTLTMVLVSAGVGMGATAALFTAVPRLRGRAGTAAREAATTSAAGASAAITGLATMGACCCTECVGAAGVAVVAAASGTNVGVLLSQNWYLDLFQLVVVGIALLAQERSLRMPADACRVPPRMDRGFVLGSLLRIALLVAGITWSLAMFVEWTQTSPLAATPALWYHWLVEHQLLALTAVGAGMFPREAAALVRRAFTGRGGGVLRVLLLVGGITWGIGVPAPLSSLGSGGFANELLGVLGAPAAWGAVAPDVGFGAALAFHWAFQHLLLGAFAILLAVRPDRALRPLLRTVEAPAGSVARVGGEPSAN